MPVCKRPMSIDGDNWDKKKACKMFCRRPCIAVYAIVVRLVGCYRFRGLVSARHGSDDVQGHHPGR